MIATTTEIVYFLIAIAMPDGLQMIAKSTSGMSIMKHSTALKVYLPHSCYFSF